MALRETFKIALLAGCLLLCFGSVFTSQKSFAMGSRELPRLQPQIHKFCSKFLKALNKCQQQQQQQQQHLSTNPSSSCSDVTFQQVTQCETAVQQAYRHINMGGCPHELRDVALCELERCGGYHGASVIHNHLPTSRRQDATMGCVTHCDRPKEILEMCVTKHVQDKMKQYELLEEKQV